MTIGLVSHGLVVGAGPSSAISTLGANLIVLWNSGTTTFATPTDNQGNVYTGLPSQLGAFAGLLAIFYCLNPTVSGTHTFSNSGTTPATAHAAFSLVASYDQQSGSDGATSGGQPGSLTPPANGALFVTATGGSVSTTFAINAGFTILDTLAPVGGTNYSLASAYLVQGTAAALNPTWTTDTQGAVVMATFRAAAGGSVVKLPPRGVVLGGGVYS